MFRRHCISLIGDTLSLSREDTPVFRQYLPFQFIFSETGFNQVFREVICDAQVS